MTTLKDAVMIGSRKERGYTIFHVTGKLDRNIYPSEREEKGPLDKMRQYIAEIGDAPFALDVSECSFVGSNSIALFTEAYKTRNRNVLVISQNEHLREILRNTKIDQFIDLYRTVDELPVVLSQ